MPTLLHQVKSMRVYSMEIHPTRLQIFDEYMVFIKRGIIKRNEATISYSHVSQVYLKRGILTSTIEIINTGGFENIEIKFLPNEDAKKAKRLIDQKISHTHSRVSPKETSLHSQAPDIEKKLARLKELLLKGQITKHEFEQKRSEMIKSI